MINTKFLTIIILSAALFLSKKGEAAERFNPSPFTTTGNEQYYINDVIDNRPSPGLGTVLEGNGLKEIYIEGNFPAWILGYLQTSLAVDTALIPLRVAVDRLKFADQGSSTKHILTLDFKIRILRVVENKEFQLYETSGKPQMSIRGFVKDAAETVFAETMKNAFKGFTEWMNNNSAQPALCKSIAVKLADDDSYLDFEKGDTIRWTRDYSLVWNDFRGKENPSSPYAAQTNCVFSYRAVPLFENKVFYSRSFSLRMSGQEQFMDEKKFQAEGTLTARTAAF